MKTWPEQGYSAFPVANAECIDDEYGLSLRDYFAAKAMQALIAHDYMTTIPLMAKDAYQVADAMLEERKK